MRNDMKTAGRTKLPQAEKVKDAIVVKGAALRAVTAQDPKSNNNPKTRRVAVWGVK
jgi:hypothetical protein